MLGHLINLRPSERRNTWVAFAILFSLIGSHSMLETARDALFLAKLPASKLPWVYLAIAAFSLVLARVQSGMNHRLSARASLSFRIGGAGVVTLVFWFRDNRLGTTGLYALYIWSGVLTTLVLVHFWTLLANIYSVTQAKRIYSVIGTGSVLGAIAGSALAGALVRFLPATELLLAASGGLLLCAFLPLLLENSDAMEQGMEEDRPSLTNALAYVVRRPYARQVALLLIVSTITVTFGDFLFKSTVAAKVPADELASFFAGVALLLNIISFVIQLTALGWIVRRFDISAALATFPLLLLGGGALFFVTTSLATALLIKGVDGSLRYSLHRTASELLFVPMSNAARQRVKAFIDIVGHRGGQAIASVIILSAVALGANQRFYALALILCAAAWIAIAIGLRPYYLNLFRQRLDGAISKIFEYPELDIASLEAIITTLDS